MSNASINVSFMKRVTTGPYEHEEMKVEFSVPSADLLDSVTADRRDFVYRTLGKPTTATNFTTPTTKSETTTSLKGENHGNGQESNEESNKETSSKKSSSKGEKASSKSKQEVKATEEVKEEVAAKTPSEPSKEEVKAEAKATKTKASNAILYDRENPDHRSTMSNFLVKLTGGKEWAKDKEKSKAASAALTGQPFLDKDGEILSSFQELCKEKFGIEIDDL